MKLYTGAFETCCKRQRWICLCPHHEVYVGSRGTDPLILKPRRWVELSGQNYNPATSLLGTNSGTCWIGSRVGPTRGLNGFGEEKSSYPKRDSNPGPSIQNWVVNLTPQNNVKEKMSIFSCPLWPGSPSTKTFVRFASRLENNWLNIYRPVKTYRKKKLSTIVKYSAYSILTTSRRMLAIFQQKRERIFTSVFEFVS